MRACLESLVKYMYFMAHARIQFLPKMTCYIITVSNDFGHSTAITGSVFKQKVNCFLWNTPCMSQSDLKNVCDSYGENDGFQTSVLLIRTIGLDSLFRFYIMWNSW